MRVLFLAAEAEPYVKVGGLGDVAGALPAALRRLGAEVKVALPRYGCIDPGAWGLAPLGGFFPVSMDWRVEPCGVCASPDGQTWFIENLPFFGSRARPYGGGDAMEQFVLFCRAALEACRRLGWTPDVIHAHDWHTAAAIRIHHHAPGRAGLVFTIHNMAHQGVASPSKWPLLGVYDGRGPVNLMEQALISADRVTTVSPTYAGEIRRPEHGFGLDGLLRRLGDRLTGILNGLDTDLWDPSQDPHLPRPFGVGDVPGKRACKLALQAELGLPQDPSLPLLGVVSRLDFQKGLSLLVDGLPDLLGFTRAQVVVLGSGEPGLEAALSRAAAERPHRVAARLAFNASLAHRIYAGSDLFLMPSLFEPCGLSQMIAMRYGALPVARATGGLVDTILDRGHPQGFGYLFGPHERGAFLGTLGRALRDYEDGPSWQAAVERAQRRDFSWEGSARRYLGVYAEAAARAGRRPR